MPLTPENAPDTSSRALPEESLVLTGEDADRPAGLGRLMLGLAFAIVALAIGVFLVIFPWMYTWNLNYFQGSIPALQDIWDEPYFRGVFTGAGLLNVYVACLQVIRLLRRH